MTANGIQHLATGASGGYRGNIELLLPGAAPLPVHHTPSNSRITVRGSFPDLSNRFRPVHHILFGLIAEDSWGIRILKVHAGSGSLTIDKMKGHFMTWQSWAVLSAIFAAGTAILAKVGIQNINSDFATFIRTIVVLLALGGILLATGQSQRLNTVSPRTYLFLTLSGLATGASWICYFRALKMGNASLVAPIDKLSVVLVAILGALFLHEKLLFRNWIGVVLIAIGAIFVGWKP